MNQGLEAMLRRSREELIGPGIKERFVPKAGPTAVRAGCPGGRVHRDQGGHARPLGQLVYLGHSRGLAAIWDDMAVVALGREARVIQTPPPSCWLGDVSTTRRWPPPIVPVCALATRVRSAREGSAIRAAA